MRPDTLVEVAERLNRGKTLVKAMAEFLDTFYGAKDARSARDMLSEEPSMTGNARHDALLGAVADYLSIQFTPFPPPAWARSPDRVLEDPWFTTTSDAPEMKEFLAHSSPAEFKQHNIFTESRPLRRKMTDRLAWSIRGEPAKSSP